MRYPKQKKMPMKSYRIENMSGIDRSGFAHPGCLQDALNLTEDSYPHWKTRPPRGFWHMVPKDENDTNTGVFFQPHSVSGACSLEEGLCWTTGTQVVAFGKVLKNVTLTATDKKQLLPVGRDLFVVPDGVLLHKNADGEWEMQKVDPDFTVDLAAVNFGTCDAQGNGKRPVLASATEPEQNGYDWLDTGASPIVLKRKNDSGTWEETSAERWFFMQTGLHEVFRENDTICITAAGQFQFKQARVCSVLQNQILITGEIFSDSSSGNELHIQRPFPLIDHAVAVGNRIWGCRCGENADGAFVNEVFCSALGDPLTWTRFGTGADDCYSASLGVPGAFTGAAALYDDVVFFKENAVICVAGSEPADFRVSCNEGKGVRLGCEKSIQKLGASLVYCGVDGVYRSNGVYAVRLCDGFLPVALENAVGGVLGEKYYLSAQNTKGEYETFVFHAGKDTWHREDNKLKVQHYVRQRNCLYMLCEPFVQTVLGMTVHCIMIYVTDHDAPGKYTNCLLADGTTEDDYAYMRDDAVDWYALTKQLDFDEGNVKRINEVSVRFELDESALFCAELRTDKGERKSLGRFTGKGLRRRTLHVNAMPCESVQLYFYGHGGCVIRDVEIVYENMKGDPAYV